MEIAGFNIENFEIFLFDMTLINNSLNLKKSQNIDGLLGGDILKEYNAIIDFEKKELILQF